MKTLHIVLILLVLVGCIVFSNKIKSNLVEYYNNSSTEELENKVLIINNNEVLGSFNNISNIGNPQIETIDGKEIKMVEFDGSHSYIEVNNVNSNNLTFELYFKLNNLDKKQSLITTSNENEENIFSIEFIPSTSDNTSAIVLNLNQTQISMMTNIVANSPYKLFIKLYNDTLTSSINQEEITNSASVDNSKVQNLLIGKTSSNTNYFSGFIGNLKVIKNIDYEVSEETENLVQQEELPVQQEELPVQQEELPIQQEELPVQQEELPVQQEDTNNGIVMSNNTNNANNANNGNTELLPEEYEEKTNSSYFNNPELYLPTEDMGINIDAKGNVLAIQSDITGIGNIYLPMVNYGDGNGYELQ